MSKLRNTSKKNLKNLLYKKYKNLKYKNLTFIKILFYMNLRKQIFARTNFW